ncbi:MAG: M20/M25/M40 family metallo-hydrolase [Tepidanaerobacteraceae bacterium]|nr:M20/M25/M40 family metallo-hydrolase [Tepidanaerobacteraceae bacterium]
MIENSREGIFKLLLELAAVPSISATAGEIKMALQIYRKLASLSYFQAHPEYLELLPIKQDPLERQIVFALVKAEPEVKKTVILTGHYDVVDVEGFGALQQYAFNPLEYTRRLSAENLPEDAKRDLESGNYIFGRGVSDMKCGLAIEMALLAEASRNPGNLGLNMMFLAVPDEENNSSGMRGAVSRLIQIRDEFDLEYVAAINCEPSGPGAPDDRHRYIFTGTVGKIMPVFYIIGKESHVGEYFGGLNASLIASCLNLVLEANPEFADCIGKDIFPPPACLKFKDLRESYSVTLPEKAVAYYNLLTVSRTPLHILESMKKAAAEAFDMAVEHIKKAASIYSQKTGNTADITWGKKIIAYRELVERVRQVFPGNMSEYVKNYLDSLPHSLDEREKAISLMGALVKHHPHMGPMIVVGFLPPYYPHRGNSGSTAKEKGVLKAVDEVVYTAARDYGIDMKVVNCFAGITDLSYFGFQGEPEELKSLSDNVPGWGYIYDIPMDDLLRLDVPVLNIGPSGKDDHKYTERLELDYSLNVAPKLLKRAVESIAGNAAELPFSS